MTASSSKLMDYVNKDEARITSNSAILEIDSPNDSDVNRLHLSQRLHANLEIEPLLHGFAKSVKQFVSVSGFAYQLTPLNLEIKGGKLAIHYYNCRLMLEDMDLGEVKFTRETPFDDTEIKQLENLLCILITPLRNAVRYQYAIRRALLDSLTGIGNREALDKDTQREVRIAHRHHQTFSVLALDLDFFKQVNDTYGHEGGDAVLKHFVSITQECIRDTDNFYRSGGEEFVLLLVKTGHQGAKLLAQRICDAVAARPCHYKEHKISLTVSIGVAQYLHGDSAQELLVRADEKLYQAKHQGRNQVSS